jgi:tRNA threonylcarbamoyladenosine biosynthesis protein TsaE
LRGKTLAMTVTANPSLTLRLHSLAETEALAARLAPLLTKGDVVLLEGPIGAGKTAFARALIRARLRRAEDVPSPSFTLIQSYDAGEVELIHADLYRLRGPADLTELGLEQAFSDAITLVEWPDRLGQMVPKQSLMLRFSLLEAEDERQIEVVAQGARAMALRDELSGAGH